jgi:hypothetical protein
MEASRAPSKTCGKCVGPGKHVQHVDSDDQRRVKSSVEGEEEGEGRRDDRHASGTRWPPTKRVREAETEAEAGLK